MSAPLCWFRNILQRAKWLERLNLVLIQGQKCKIELLKQLMICHWFPQFHYTNEQKLASFSESYEKWFPTFWTRLAFRELLSLHWNAMLLLGLKNLWIKSSETNWVISVSICCTQVSVAIKYHLGQNIHEWTKWNLWKTAFKKFYLVHSWILCPINSQLNDMFVASVF